jgi:amino acid adenylation domain-containing protein
MTDLATGRARREGPVTALNGTALNRKEEALWLFQRLFPGIAVDNLPLAVRTSADLDVATVRAAVTEVMGRHRALRTRFPLRDGACSRQVLDEAQPPVDALTIPRERLATTLTGLALAPFDLTRDLPFRVTLVSLREGGCVLCVVWHHITSDGISGGVVVPEIVAACHRLAPGGAASSPSGGGPSPDGAPPTLVEGPCSPESLRFWIDALDGVNPAGLALHGARPEPVRPTFAGARFERELSTAAQDAVRVLRSRLRATDNMVLLAAYCLMLARHGAGPDLVIAVPVNVRRRDVARAVGYHVNTLPLRVTVDLRGTFTDLVAQVRDRLAAALAHSDVSFENLLGELHQSAVTWRVPLCRHMFNYLPPSGLATPGPLPEATWVTVDPGTSRYDLQFVLVRSARAMSLQAAYSTEIHDEAYVRSLADRFEALLVEAGRNPGGCLATLDLWSPAERALVAGVNASAGAPVPATTVPELIAARMGSSPGAPALIEAGGRTASLSQLGRRAGRVRGALSRAGVAPGDVVALHLPRGEGLAAAALAAWSLGAAYLPLDQVQAPRRLALQLDDAAVRVVVSDRDLAADASAGRHVVRLDAPDGTGDDAGDGLEALRAGLAAADREALAYTIFTSGSTGRPKGVEVTHDNLANLIRSFALLLDVSDEDRVLWLTTFGFDISALELFLGLAHGGGAVVAPDEAQVRPAVLLDLITRQDPAIVQSTPTIWRLVSGRLAGELAGRRVLSGGEPLSGALATRLVEAGCRLYNVYGPTETTIWSTVAAFTPGPDVKITDPVGVGAPIGETSLHVIDEFGEDLPPGIVGELVIGGTGVARGYTRSPERTARRFRHDAVRGRYYATGDLARWRADGTIELLGRADRQVKLRGRRIEPGEIEAAAERHPAVAAAAVVVRGDRQGDGRLVGYLQPADPGDTTFDTEEVGRYLRSVLPYYLVPADLVRLDRLPRNPSGKVDYEALPEVTAPRPSPDGDPGSDPLQDDLVTRLVGIWDEVLDRPECGARTDFFAAGGHSLLAAVLAARIAEETGHDVSLPDVFDAPTPYELALIVRARQGPNTETEVER